MTLLERVEGATSVDRALADDVLLALGWRKTCVGHFYGPLYMWSDGKRSYREDARPNPLASLDAVLALVETKLPNLLWRVWQSNPGEYAADIGDEDTTYAPTPALALLKALLTALEAGDG